MNSGLPLSVLIGAATVGTVATVGTTAIVNFMSSSTSSQTTSQNIVASSQTTSQSVVASSQTTSQSTSADCYQNNCNVQEVPEPPTTLLATGMAVGVAVGIKMLKKKNTQIHR